MSNAVEVMNSEVETEVETVVLHLASDESVQAVHRKVLGYNRKAANCGCPPAEMVVEDAMVNDVMVNRVIVTYSIAKHVGKWRILGSIEPAGGDAEDGLCIINLMPGVPGDFSQFRHHDMSCDHCGHNRRRNKVILIEDCDSKDLYTVGTSCLKSFTGIDPRMALLWEQWRQEVVDELEETSRNRQSGGPILHFSTRSVAEHAIAIVMKSGKWHKADRDMGDSGTGGLVMNAVMDCGGSDAVASEKYDINDDIRAVAAKHIDHFANLDAAEVKNEFVAKVVAMAKAGGMRVRHLTTFAAGIAIAYLREVEAKAKAARPERKDEWIATSGRISFTGTITRVRFLGAGQFGDRFLVAGQDDQGREWVWFTNRSFESGPVNVTGTVKDVKDDPKWGKSTILTRCKIEGA